MLLSCCDGKRTLSMNNPTVVWMVEPTIPARAPVQVDSRKEICEMALDMLGLNPFHEWRLDTSDTEQGTPPPGHDCIKMGDSRLPSSTRDGWCSTGNREAAR